MRILAVEPYFGGSHRSFVEVIQTYSRHKVEVETLPPRFWKWRLSGSPFLMAEKFRTLDPQPDFLLFSNTIDVATFVALAGEAAARLPKVIYFHENQIVYPLSEQASPDIHFGLINIASAAVCDEVWFNSDFHRRVFLNALDPFLNQFPDFVPKQLGKKLSKRTGIMPVPIDPLPEVEPALPKGKPLRILWNHRWEYDKDPESFFAALERLITENIDFEVAILGEDFQRRPRVFDRSKGRLGDRVLCYGYVGNRKKYAAWVRSCDVVVSCARQEYFGISVAEAVLAGCHPVLPNRLVYPDFIPKEKQSKHLYNNEAELVAILRDASRNVENLRAKPSYPYYDDFVAPKVVARFDEAIERIVSAKMENA